ncbi:MAG: ATP-grasp domain-containing protein [Alphaproteobacteria bacterium]|nr:ATP-grasp domain-containing protein [Alphaproteobacteria bacterium]
MLLDRWEQQDAAIAMDNLGYDATLGFPPLAIDFNLIGAHEFLPKAFYYPVIAHWILLGLWRRNWDDAFHLNSALPFGGLVGEDKWQVGTLMAKELASHVPLTVRVTMLPFENTMAIDTASVEQQLAVHNMTYPMVVKPLRGCRGQGVGVLHDAAAMRRHVNKYLDPHDQVLFQQLVPWAGEAGVGFVKNTQGEIDVISLTFKVQPFLVGDGVSSLGTLIRRHPRFGKLQHLYLPRHQSQSELIIPKGETYRLAFVGSHSGGGFFVDGNAYIDDALTRRVQAIIDAIDGIVAGRFDIRFRDWQDFLDGKDFALIELNGLGGEMTHVWDPRHTVFTAWRAWFDFNRRVFALARHEHARDKHAHGEPRHVQRASAGDDAPRRTYKKRGFFALARQIARAIREEKSTVQRYDFPLP